MIYIYIYIGAFALSVKEIVEGREGEMVLLTFLIERRGIKLTIRGTEEKFMTLHDLIEVIFNPILYAISRVHGCFLYL